MLKRVGLFVIVALPIAQFFQPDRSAPGADPALDMLVMTNAPQDIRALVTGACYDCHSYTSNYPWYAYVSPMSFIVQDHIVDGRKHLNFSLWDKYATDKHAAEAGKELEEGEMPPGYYRLMHGHGRMSNADKQKLVAWFNANLGSVDGGGGMDTEGEEEEAHH